MEKEKRDKYENTTFSHSTKLVLGLKNLKRNKLYKFKSLVVLIPEPL